MYSVIIPTMWRSTQLAYMLPALIQHSLIGEIIVINNDASKTPEYFSSLEDPRIVKITPGNNIGVNPAWNLGVRTSKFDKLCFLSDDIEFDINVFNFLNDKLEEKDGLVGVYVHPWPREGATEIKLVEKMIFGYGALMFMNKKNYIPIPEEFKIFFGDVFMFIASLKLKKQPRILLPVFCKNKLGTTSESPEFSEQTKFEHDLWEKTYHINPRGFFY